MAGPDASEGQAVWQPGAEEDSRLRVGDRRRLLHYNEEDNDYKINIDADIVYSDNGGIDDTVATPH